MTYDNSSCDLCIIMSRILFKDNFTFARAVVFVIHVRDPCSRSSFISSFACGSGWLSAGENDRLFHCSCGFRKDAGPSPQVEAVVAPTRPRSARYTSQPKAHSGRSQRCLQVTIDCPTEITVVSTARPADDLVSATSNKLMTPGPSRSLT